MFCRVRPMLPGEQDAGENEVVDTPSDFEMVVGGAAAASASAGGGGDGDEATSGTGGGGGGGGATPSRGRRAVGVPGSSSSAEAIQKYDFDRVFGSSST